MYTILDLLSLYLDKIIKRISLNGTKYDSVNENTRYDDRTETRYPNREREIKEAIKKL